MAASNQALVDDLKDERVPNALYWTVQQVSDWIESIGFPMYKECFSNNLIDGRKLIMCPASRLPDLGITDFLHIKTITAAVQQLLELEQPFWNRSISLPPRNEIGMYLEIKAQKGQNIDDMTFEKFLLNNEDPKWQAPLNNYCSLLPSH